MPNTWKTKLHPLLCMADVIHIECGAFEDGETLTVQCLSFNPNNLLRIEVGTDEYLDDVDPDAEVEVATDTGWLEISGTSPDGSNVPAHLRVLIQRPVTQLDLEGIEHDEDDSHPT